MNKFELCTKRISLVGMNNLSITQPNTTSKGNNNNISLYLKTLKKQYQTNWEIKYQRKMIKRFRKKNILKENLVDSDAVKKDRAATSTPPTEFEGII